MASGIAWLSLNTDTFLSEYTTKSPSTAAGSTFPRYFIYFGVSLFAGKAIKGKNHIASIIGLSVSFICLIIFKGTNFIIPSMLIILAALTLLRGRFGQ